ncbi:MAG: 50S ribosomal protein L4 [Thaumarchaeota archaeon]|nr:50S ribosomal protein L4 [Nitrososphaerota archaeon]
MVAVIDLNGETSGQVDLPEVFSGQLRADLVKRAFWILNSHGIQPYGRDPMAGEKTSAESGHPPTGRGISRIPRVKGERSRRSGQAAGVASVVGGRLPHPPRSEKSIYQKINRKEKGVALDAAIAFTGNAEAVAERGHRVGALKFPLVVTDDVEAVSKTAELDSFLQKLGLSDELKRLYGGVKRQSGKARMRGRAYKERVGPLIVVSNDRGIGKAADSIPGVKVVPVDSVSVLHLAPAGVGGRLTLWTASSLDMLASRGGSKEAGE